MEKQGEVKPNNWVHILNKIRDKYNDEYCNVKSPKHSIDFTPISFKGTKEPYLQLRTSFKKELSLVLPGKKETEINAMIPGINTFAEMYRVGYMPKGLLLNGCYYYATGNTKEVFEKENPSLRIDIEFPVTDASGLIIHHPLAGEEVPRFLVIKGEVINASRIWVVVRSSGNDRYWVQPEIKVSTDGIWERQIYIGSADKGDIGARYQIRAFVHPTIILNEGYELDSWPEAQLSSEVIEVVRGSANYA